MAGLNTTAVARAGERNPGGTKWALWAYVLAGYKSAEDGRSGASIAEVTSVQLRQGIWKLMDKARRRARRLARRPDNTPWLMEPSQSSASGVVDFIFALDYLGPNSWLVKTFQEAMGAYGLSLLLVNKTNIQKVTDQISSGWLRPSVYLDLSSWPGDAFEALLKAADERGVYTIRRWSQTPWIQKAHTHRALGQAGLPVPPTVIIGRDEPNRDLTEAERELVGERVAIKPSGGGANRGVIIGVAPTRENIAKARDYDRKDDWLVQRMISWAKLGQRNAYLRGYNVCGQRTIIWWCKDGGHDGYEILKWEDIHRHDLMPAVRLVDRLAEVTGMDFFSTEIAIVRPDGPVSERYCLIDYVNDQCDMDPYAHPQYSPPQPLCRWMCQRIAEFTWKKKTGAETDGSFRGLWLPA
jgi:hypothetical protein